LLTFAHLLANQSANYRRQSCRPEGGLNRRVTTEPLMTILDWIAEAKLVLKEKTDE
jgi:hypothetical protein